ncbi:MAG: WecB/TagA/CpsF family glycosyltransferase [Solirubrobacterales bacterium]
MSDHVARKSPELPQRQQLSALGVETGEPSRVALDLSNQPTSGLKFGLSRIDVTLQAVHRRTRVDPPPTFVESARFHLERTPSRCHFVLSLNLSTDTAITKRSVCGVLIDTVEMDEAVARVLERARSRAPYSVSALAVHGVMTGVESDTHRARLNRLDMVVPDGQPVRWALNLLYRSGLGERVFGPILMLELCAAAAAEGLPIYLYGSTPETLAVLEKKLTARFPGLQVAGCRPSRFGMLDETAKEEVAAVIRSSGAAICFVGLGCPRQETFCWAMRDRVGVPVLAVGAAFDFNADLARQAPAWMQRHGLQWLHRLAGDPRRLWRRYLLLNPAYLALLAGQALRVWRPRASTDPSLAGNPASTPTPG